MVKNASEYMNMSPASPGEHKRWNYKQYPMTMSCAKKFGGSKLKIVLESTVSASCSENMAV